LNSADNLSSRNDASSRSLLARSCRLTTNSSCLSAQGRRTVPTTAAFWCLPPETILAPWSFPT